MEPPPSDDELKSGEPHIYAYFSNNIVHSKLFCILLFLVGLYLVFFGIVGFNPSWATDITPQDLQSQISNAHHQ
jgi:hypothetical protein